MGEPFDWLEAKRNPDVARAQKARREAMIRQELEERAALLHRLGHAKDVVRARLTANLRWDFEGVEAPLEASDVDAIIDRVFGAGAATRPAARTKGGTK
jgi:hypothetical protein